MVDTENSRTYVHIYIYMHTMQARKTHLKLKGQLALKTRSPFSLIKGDDSPRGLHFHIAQHVVEQLLHTTQLKGPLPQDLHFKQVRAVAEVQ